MNSAVASAATVPLLDDAEVSYGPSFPVARKARELGMRVAYGRSGNNTLWLRVVSALVLAPLPVAAIWFGWPWLPLLTGAAAAVMAWEWGRLCRGGHFGRTGMLLVAVVLAAVAAAALASTGLALGTALCGAGLVLWAARKARDAE